MEDEQRLEAWETQPRDDMGRFSGPPDYSELAEENLVGSGGGGGGDVAGAAVQAAKEGGGTLNPQTGEALQPGAPGYVVAMPGHSGIYPDSQFFSDDAAAQQTVRDWMDANSEVLSQPGMNVGVWHDTANGEVVLDPSEVVSDQATAVQLGIARDQQSIWDNGNMAEIPTGGTGGRSQTSPAQAPSNREAEQALFRDDGRGEGRASGTPRGPGQGEPGEVGREVAPLVSETRYRPYRLPAHRFEDRKKGKPGKGQRTWVFDYDGTITGAPDQIVRIATGLRALGDYLIVLTGSILPRADLVKQLSDFGMPYDDLVQYHDDGTDGQARVHYLKQFGAWGGFDNRIDRAPILIEVCPHLFVVAAPIAPDDKGAKKDAKKTAKKLGLRGEQRGAPRVPPNYRPMDTTPPGAKPLPEGSCCGGCDMNNAGLCWGYGNVRIEADHVCDSFDPEQDQAGSSADTQ